MFRIAPGRHASESRMLLGERFAGIVCSDRYGGYDYLDPHRRPGSCWAHLLRDFTAHSEGMAEQQQFGTAALAITHDLFAAWQAYRQQRRARLQAQTAPPQEKLRALLEHASRRKHENECHRQFANNLLKRWPALSALHPHPRRRADQQPRRTRPPRRRHLPASSKTAANQNMANAQMNDSFGLGHLPPPQTVALRLPHPSPHRPRPRRPNTQPHLTPRG